MRPESERWKALLRPEEGCPELEDIAGLVHGELSATTRGRLKAHVDACPRCTAELALYRENFGQLKVAPGEDADVEWIKGQLEKRCHEIFGEGKQNQVRTRNGLAAGWKGLFSMRGLPAMALAAAVMLLAVGIYLHMKTSPELKIPGIDSASQELRSVRIEITYPLGDVTGVPSELRWNPSKGAVRYEVRILEVDRTELWKGSSAVANVLLPKEVQSRILPGKKLLWQVTAFNSEGRMVASSAETAFRLAISPNREVPVK